MKINKYNDKLMALETKLYMRERGRERKKVSLAPLDMNENRKEMNNVQEYRNNHFDPL